MTETKKQIKMEKNIKLNQFKAAKEIALSIAPGQMRRAIFDNVPVNYSGANIGGRMFVIGDSLNDIQNPDCFINELPAREVFGDFTVMSK